MNLQDEQERMKERWANREELGEIADLFNRTDLICKYCKVGNTRASRMTGEILPCKSCISRQMTLKKYGLSLRDFFAMLSEQHGKCAVCCETLQRPLVDHCHELGHVRGLVCAACNTMIGLAKDNPDVLKNAAKYVENNRFSRSWSAKSLD